MTTKASFKTLSTDQNLAEQMNSYELIDETALKEATTTTPTTTTSTSTTTASTGENVPAEQTTDAKKKYKIENIRFKNT
jgi:hypothetical protein